MSEQTHRPASVTNVWTTATAIPGFGIGLALIVGHDWSMPASMLALAAITIAPVVALDLLVDRVHRRASTGLDWHRRPRYAPGRVALKLLGLATTVAAIGLAWSLFPEYERDYYAGAHRLVAWLSFEHVVVLVAICVVYIAYVDARMHEPRDSYWAVGRLVATLGVRRDVDWRDLGEHVREWCVKGFFVPVMLVFLSDRVMEWIDDGVGGFSLTPMSLEQISVGLVFGLEVCLALVGYILTLRLLDTHVRTVEPTGLGWAVTLICYPPFLYILTQRYMAYDSDGLGWSAWLFGETALVVWPWAAAIVVSAVLYAWATVIFGARFSNLCHRGIITNGPYRFTKHPAYLFKNIHWWLVSMPFVSAQGPLHAAGSCLLLLGINLVYFWRARTEERHLSWDPDYVAYARWIEAHGVFRWVGRLVPFVRFGARVSGTRPSRRDGRWLAQPSGSIAPT